MAGEASAEAPRVKRASGPNGGYSGLGGVGCVRWMTW
jgi:hypothetical protein